MTGPYGQAAVMALPARPSSAHTRTTAKETEYVGSTCLSGEQRSGCVVVGACSAR